MKLRSWLLLALVVSPLAARAQSVTWPSAAGVPNYSGSKSWGVSYSASNPIPAAFLPFAAPGPIGTSTPSAGQFNSLISHGLSDLTGNEFLGLASGGAANSTGGLNAAFGDYALSSLTTGNGNVAIGQAAAYSLTTGGQNVAIGNNALTNCTTCLWNTAIGWGALGSGQMSGSFPAGSENTAVGWFSQAYQSTGSQNTSVGENSMTQLVSGSYNTTVGADSQSSNATGSFNTTFGHDAMTGSNPAAGTAASCASGPFVPYSASYNTAIGEGAYCTSTTGQYNTVVGWQAGVGLNSGSGNTYLGTYAGSLNTVTASNGSGNNNTYIGYLSGPGTGNNAVYTNSTALGFNALVSASNQVVIGNANVTQVLLPSGVSIASTDLGAPAITFSPNNVNLTVNGVSGTPAAVVATVPSGLFTSVATQPLATFYTTAAAGQYQVCAALSVVAAGAGSGQMSTVINYTSDGSVVDITMGGAVLIASQGTANIGISANDIPNCFTAYLDANTSVGWEILASGQITAAPTMRYGFKLTYLGL